MYELVRKGYTFETEVEQYKLKWIEQDKWYVNAQGKIHVPDNVASETLQWIHLATMHGGINKMFYSYNRYVHISNWEKRIKEVLNNCQECLENKISH